MLLLVLLACNPKPADTAPAPDDTSGEGGDDTGASGELSLGDAPARFVGAPSSATGSAVAGPGDLDGDGAADVAIAAFYGNRVCVFYGPIAPGDHAVDDGACVAGGAVYDFAGYAVAGAGDTDGDGRAELLVSAIGQDDAGTEGGKVYLLKDPPEVGSTPIDDAAAATWTGEAAGDYAGTALAAVGDVDGDGTPDLLFGASGCDAGGGGGGRAYLLRGPFADGAASLSGAWATFTGVADGSGAPPAHGATTGGDALGDAVASAGDVNGDGLADLLLGGSGADAGGADAGVAWLVLGPAGAGDHVAADADARLVGSGASAYAGGAVAGPGDLDGDGNDDFAVTADGWENGTVYVFFGAVSGDMDVAAAPLVVTGDPEDDQLGWSLAGAGDLDGDGRPDLAIGAPGCDSPATDAGCAFVLPGSTGSGTYALRDAAVRIAGEATGDAAGRAVAGAGDADGDGDPDLLVGGLYNQDGGVFAGTAWLVGVE